MTKNEQILDCEIQACGIDKVEKLKKDVPHSFTPEQLDIIKVLCEQSFIEGRDSGFRKTQEIINIAFDKVESNR